ncbi:hypothetical protein [Pantoea sp. SJZ147]|uniref:hypothetical protein n=1 Tax=Pantoea sp. SJZ147 TaxID=2572896 RepID=UPI0011AABD95|nr:hypothetical protein [Pantoea sp. SJZ147]TWD43879.1 hypothetical protein FBY13_1026 [Pantoea sp. SJZ147]
MGSEEDTSKKALELIGCIVPRLLSKKSGAPKEDVIRALRRIGQKTCDWRVREGCKKAVQMLNKRVH